ncbi:sugar kinase [Agrobacterium sp. MS2]|uniref:sugar kinase n=1 Tax=Agrobacterium sp. MS2 TaxID=1345498 RepID=UPI000DC053F5|nr:sugar kinase [Agrobacterium sp. MS2]RAL96031.1 sugar kinase [Agrobacterium sp. MS2]
MIYMEGRTARPRVVCIGETMGLFHAKAVGMLSYTRDLSLAIGGAESNVAIGLSRLGIQSAWVGRLGADSIGDVIVHDLRAEDVQVHAVRDPESFTGLMVKERRTSQFQNVWYARKGSAGSRLKCEDIPRELIAQCSILHVSGITAALSDNALEALKYAISIARQSRTLVSFDINYRRALWSQDTAGKVLLPLVASSDIVFAGEDEAEMLVGPGDAATQAQLISKLGPTQVLIKRGAKGCEAFVDGKRLARSAVSVPVVDTVGAGDAFACGYLAEMLERKDLEERLDTAVKCGAFACLSAGDWEGLPRRRELAALNAGEAVSR